MVAFKNPVVQYLVIPSGTTSGQRIVIDGIAGTITVYDSNNNIVGQWSSTGVMLWKNDADTGMIRVEPNGEAGTGPYPGIYFFAANTSGGYANPAWIQANPDANNNPQLGFNGGPWIDTSGLHLTRGRMFLRDHVASLNNIDTVTEVPVGGSFEAYDDIVKMVYYDPASTQTTSIRISNNLNANTDVPILYGVWTNVTFANGWSSAGGFSPVQARIDTSGYLRLRGNAAPGTTADGTVMFTLPAGFAPVQSNVLPAAVTASVNPTTLSRVIINANGTVQVFGVAFAGFLTVSLAGIGIDTNQFTA